MTHPGVGADVYDDATDEWATPPRVTRELAHAVGGFDLDPASGAERAPHADETYTAEQNGLAQPWFGSVWCNPPYSEKEDWIKKALGERDRCDVIVMLLPVDTSTQWFHNYTTEADAVVFIEGRLAFGDAESTANFASMFVVFGDVTPSLHDTLSGFGAVFQGPWTEHPQATLENR